LVTKPEVGLESVGDRKYCNGKRPGPLKNLQILDTRGMHAGHTCTLRANSARCVIPTDAEDAD
jgi:hypothetical protein